MRKLSLISKLFTLAILLMCGKSQASHLMGGQITYTYVSGNTYTVTLKLYRDCGGVPLGSSAPIRIYNGATNVQNLNLGVISITDVSILCPGQVSNCTSTSPSAVPGIQEHVYQGNVTLPTGTNVSIRYDVCCRNAAITNLVSPSGASLFLETKVNTLDAAGNSSPQLLNLPVAQFCAGSLANINPNGSDANGDVISYSLVSARGSGGANLPYNAGFSGTNPLTTVGGVSINSSTGAVSFTSVAAPLQVAVIAIRATETRVISGVPTVIGEVTREIQVRTINCSGNNPPVLPALPNVVVPVGTNYCVNINATDAATQTISLNAVASIIPPASFTITSSGAGFTNSQFCFTPQLSDAGNTYTVTVNAQDNSCPAPGQSATSFNITVPSITCTTSVAGSATAASCGLNDGTATASLTNGVAPFNYTWTGPGGYNNFQASAMPSTISGLTPGTYHVAIVDAYQCASEADIIVPGAPPLQLSSSVSGTTCGLSNGSIDVSVVGGQAPYSFSLNGAPAVGSGLFTGLMTGTYTVDVADALNCNGSVTLTVNPENDVTPPTAVCQSINLVLNDQGQGVITEAMIDNGSSDNCGIVSMTLSQTGFDCSEIGANTVTLTVYDAAGNSSTCTAIVTVIDNTPPEHVDCNAVTLNLDASGNATLTTADVIDEAHINSHEPCGPVSVSLGQTQFDCMDLGLNTVVVTVTDENGNTATCEAQVTVVDASAPTITCPSDITVAAGNAGCTALVTYLVSGSDNCTYSITQGAGLASGSAFPLGTTPNEFTITDLSGASATCGFDVIVTSNLAVNAGTDEKTYYGYSMDQTVNRTVAATGGVGSKSYNWTLSRPLMCNVLNSTGDEVFNAGSCVNNLCPSSGSPLFAPSCTNTTGAVTAKLIEDADVCVTVTDAIGCVASDCFNINSIDARCFAGNSNNVKVKVCHATNSTTNPWVQICIADAAVATHLGDNHNDCLGNCPCGARLSNSTAGSDFGMHVYPNPTSDRVTIEFDSPKADLYEMTIFNVNGEVVRTNSGDVFEGGNQLTVPVDGIAGGVYFMRLRVAETSSTVRLVITN